MVNLDIIVADQKARKLSEKDGHLYLNDQKFDVRFESSSNGNLLAITETKVFEAEIISHQGKNILLKIDGHEVQVMIKDKLDLLLEKLGMNTKLGKVIKEIKAPMPGLIHDVLVIVGQQVKKGDSLIILEAMKMENLIKAPSDIEVKQIFIKQGDNVEKDQPMMIFK